ncbi:MAG: DUF3857 and transglutaminase domain-containing protein [Bacteroidales bacterium]|nr:DUF3857 and transglutaminase domain-containing protein [Bacteroidales bacterium]
MKKILSLSLMISIFCSTIFSQNIQQLMQSCGDSEKFPDADEVVVFDSTTVFVKETGLSYVQMHKLVKVLTPKGVMNNTAFVIDYDPLSAYVEINKVLIHKADGSIKEVTDSVLDYVAPARAIYWGASQKMIALEGLQPGDAFEVWSFRKGFTYALLQATGDEDEARYIPPMRGHFYDIVPFWSDVPMCEKFYSVNIQTQKNLHFQVYNGTVQTEQKVEGDRTIFTFISKDFTPIKPEPNMVSKNDVLPKLLLSTSPNWEAKSMWFYGVNEDYGSFIPTPELKSFVDSIIAPARTELDSISIIVHWVADNMRYSGISMGEGEGFTLHNAEMNFRDRCGVCKDKASLCISMLRAAGFEAYAAMTMAGERIDRIPADQFNHSVTVVKRADGTLQLLDPTWVPFLRELWSSAEQQQGYLMGLPQGADLKETPVSDPKNHYFVMKAKSSIDKKGTLNCELFVTAEGQSDAAVRAIFNGLRKDWASNVENDILSIDPRAQIIDKKYTTTDNYLDGPVEITIKFQIPNYAVVTTKEVIFQPFTSHHPYRRVMGELNINTTPETRQYPFRDRTSRTVEITETITVPYNKVAVMPETKKASNDAVQYEGGYTLKGKKLTFKESGSFGKRIYDADDWSAFREAVSAQKYFENEPVILTK